MPRLLHLFFFLVPQKEGKLKLVKTCLNIVINSSAGIVMYQSINEMNDPLNRLVTVDYDYYECYVSLVAQWPH